MTPIGAVVGAFMFVLAGIYAGLGVTFGWVNLLQAAIWVAAGVVCAVVQYRWDQEDARL